MRWSARSLVLMLAAGARMFAASDAAAFEAGPLTRERVAAAARAAGFRVSAVSADIPAAIRPRFPFAAPDYDDPLLDRLRAEYRLDQVVATPKTSGPSSSCSRTGSSG